MADKVKVKFTGVNTTKSAVHWCTVESPDGPIKLPVGACKNGDVFECDEELALRLCKLKGGKFYMVKDKPPKLKYKAEDEGIKSKGGDQ